MGWIEKPNVNTTVNMPNGLPTFPKISSFVKNIINSAQFYFHESEAFEVKEVFLYTHEDRRKYEKSLSGRPYMPGDELHVDSVPDSASTVSPEFIGSVNGTFINNPDQEIKGGYVKPLNPEKAHYPVVGEHVSVIEYNGQHYYKEIINLKNSPNENAAPGATPGYEKNTKYGETFKRQDIRSVKVCEGEIVYEGRFGNSMKLGCNHKNNSPIIKLRAGQKKLNSEKKNLSKERVNENIDKDASSIYLVSNGMQFNGGSGGFDGKRVKGKKILIKSDGIFISGRENINIRASKKLLLEADEVFINAKKVGTIKMGDPRSVFIPTINGQKLFELITSLTKVLLGLPQLVSANPKALADIAKGTNDIVSQLKNKEFLNMQVMTADPNVKIPELELKRPRKPLVIPLLRNVILRLLQNVEIH